MLFRSQGSLADRIDLRRVTALSGMLLAVGLVGLLVLRPATRSAIDEPVANYED